MMSLEKIITSIVTMVVKVVVGFVEKIISVLFLSTNTAQKQVLLPDKKCDIK